MNKNKIMASLLALVMMLSVFAPFEAFAAEAVDSGKTKVVVHKMHQERLEDVSEKAKQKGYNGGEIKPQDYTEIFGDKSKELENVKFIVYKVTDSDLLKELADSTNKTKYDTEEKIKASDKKDKFTQEQTQTTGRGNAGATFTLDKGSYWFIEDQTTVRDGNKVFAGAVAVPFLLELPVYKQNGEKFSETDALHVYPKNTTNAPEIDKNFVKTHGLEAAKGFAGDDAQALKDVGAVLTNYEKEKATVSAEIGKEIPYEVVTKIPAKSLYQRLVWQDSMTKGLTYKKDLEIKYGESADTANTKLETPADYKIEQNDSGFILTLEKAGIEKLEKAAADKDIYVKLTYHATVNSKAVVDQPDKNNISFDYNNKPGENTDPREKTVKGTEVKVEKTWADGSSNQAPADAKVTYYLYKKGSGDFSTDTLVDSVIKTKDFSHTFSNLEDGDYYVKEFVQGYTPEYTTSENGTIKLNNNKKPGTPLVPKTPEIVTGGKKFVKTNDKAGNELKRLAGAEFVIQNKNTNDNTNNGKYLKINDSNVGESEYLKAEKNYQEFIKKVNEALAKGKISAENKVDNFDSDQAIKGEVDRLEKARNEAFVKANLNYTWVDKEQATKFYSNDRGQFEVKGLAYGDYQAVETQAPAGYALPTGGGSFTFKVEKGSYTSEENGINYELEKTQDKDAKQIKNNKVTIPQTGGIGTVIFTVAGLAIMGGAFYAMKKRNEEQEEA
ncbi:pilin N-terminal domain-containing protein [Peptoniphilus indolicus]|uniref:Cell wall surface anchor family protein n=2 Tax=Peptoniphilus indolicus TaxID=33030 RepID=G4D2K0_9FIRM|nr:pilin N-terminal domain-containing protein [Peptoniphilus indolicus]EGY80248.1 cell wall surface anchor family protein [Peptoniphilus indolicus ATCC 29427]